MLTFGFEFWIVVDRAVQKENKYGKSLCDIDILWCLTKSLDYNL